MSHRGNIVLGMPVIIAPYSLYMCIYSFFKVSSDANEYTGCHGNTSVVSQYVPTDYLNVLLGLIPKDFRISNVPAIAWYVRPLLQDPSSRNMGLYQDMMISN